MLIRNADIHGHGPGDLRISGGKIIALGRLEPLTGERVIDAGGGFLLPGLHDHHIHLAAIAARKASIPCGPPEVADEAGLAAALASPGSAWLRGIGFHESVTGGVLPDAAMLDRIVPHRPVRLQHSTGRMWLFNSLGLGELLAASTPPPGLEHEGGRYTGRLFDEDRWLREALGSTPPDFGAVSADLAALGITGITDMSPGNDAAMAAHFSSERAGGRLVQHIVLAGTLALADAAQHGWRLGPAKLHLHEAALPAFDDAARFITAAHAQHRAVAVHCVSEVELVYALALFEEVGPLMGDRIEHVSVASAEHLAQMAALGLAACVQPHFITERGDRYLAEVEPRYHADLYRLRSLAGAGIALSGGSDAPYGDASPWAAMAAAVSRQTSGGSTIEAGEALTPEDALALWLADPFDFTRQRRIEPGAPADLCLLDRPWKATRQNLGGVQVRATWISGKLIHQSVDQLPFERLPGADPAA